MKKFVKRHGRFKAMTTDGLHSYKATMKESGNAEKQRPAGGPTTDVRTHTFRSDDEIVRCPASGRWRRSKSSAPSTPPSIRTDTSSAGKHSRPKEHPPWPSGRLSSDRPQPPCPSCANWRLVDIGPTAPARQTPESGRSQPLLLLPNGHRNRRIAGYSSLTVKAEKLDCHSTPLAGLAFITSGRSWISRRAMSDCLAPAARHLSMTSSVSIAATSSRTSSWDSRSELARR